MIQASSPAAPRTHQAPPRAARLLERALLVTLLAHAVAMLALAALLLPGLPGGGDPASRVAYVAAHPWRWRLGWLPWHLTAISDLALAAALLLTDWIGRAPAILVLLATLGAVLVEQPAQLAWSLSGPRLAGAAMRGGDLAPYLRFESGAYLQVAAWAAAIYTIVACGWTWCFVRAGVWRRPLTWLSGLAWGVLFGASVGPLLPAGYRPAPALIAAGNAVGFVGLLAWLGAVSELTLRRSRPDERHGRMAPWVHPRQDAAGRLLNALAGSRLARAVGERMPLPAFVSDITNVFYANYLVEADRLAPLVPWGLELQRLGRDGAYALFTHLTYQHGHFGPRLLGPLRRFMPSPVQSNWRIYVRDPQTKLSGIYFVTTAISQTVPGLAARLMSEGIPMHCLRQGEVHADGAGAFRVSLDPGAGSGPDLAMDLRGVASPALAPPWSDCFESFAAMLAYCVPQDRAMSSQPWYGRITRQEIELGIPLEACEPLDGECASRAAQALVGDARPLCFRVPRVTLRFGAEIYDQRDAAHE
jgi:hypothetical protein